jgi:formate hydrogenlyase subunit 3/multisubunit Na+/H+ antiporter MnhD subunit
LAGFISKWHISLGAIQSGQIVFLFIILAGSLLDVIYFFPVIRTAFFGKMPENQVIKGDLEEKVELYSQQTRSVEAKRPIYLLMVVPLSITAVFSILLCLFPRMFYIYDLALAAVENIFGGM